ncbi:MAG: hypothetical protein IIB60_06265, partial [Planctomycetes bacterium]|nr:hypothetical protein [Planctomycetota bacterium]
LLNEPALLAEVGGLPDVERIEDERDRCIAKAIGELFDEFGEFGPADVLVRCHEEADAARVAELASRGAARSNYESTLRLALERIERASRTRGLDVETRMLASAESQGSTDAAGRLETVRDGVKAHSHFAPRRMLRQAAMAALPTGGEATDADTMDSNTMDGDRPNTTTGVEQQ